MQDQPTEGGHGAKSVRSRTGTGASKFGKYPVQLVFAPDQCPIQTLSPNRAHPAYWGLPSKREKRT